MLAWWRRFWNRGRKNIFQYWDGHGWRYADPMQAIHDLQTHPTFNWSVHPQQIAMGDYEALQITSKAVRDVFLLPEFDRTVGLGLTQHECCELLTQFVGYLDGLKKSGSPSQSRPQSTAAESSPMPESIRASTTNASLASPGESPGSECVIPSPSPQESVSD